MQDKHKVTLYLPPNLHRQLKIRSAVEFEPMSTIAERALAFYLTHADVVDGVEASQGQVHRVYNCPECTSSLVVRDGEMVAVQGQAGALSASATTSRGQEYVVLDQQTVLDQQIVLDQQGEEKLVPC
jgi:hypothetical protein